jgi:replication factor A1
MAGGPEQTRTKVKDLSPSAKQAHLVAKVVTVGERRDITTRTGQTRQLSEAVVGDETGTVIMSLWDDQIDAVNEGDVLSIQNGYVSLVRGHMRLNVGKYGAFTKSESVLGEVNTANDLSALEFEPQRREYRGSFGGGRYQERGRRDRGGF